MQAYIQFPQPDGSFRYYAYDGSAKTIAQANADFTELSTYTAKVAATSATKPVLAAGFDRWKIREAVVIDTPGSSLFGAPRTLLGTHNGYNVYSLTGYSFLWEQYVGSPDTGAPKGGNLEGIVFAPGMSLPAGLVSTGFSGQAPPAAWTALDYRALGYRKRYFGGQADQAYYEYSTAADETPNVVEVPPSGTITTGVVASNPSIGTFSVSNNGTKWKVTLNTTFAITSGNNAYFYIDGEQRSDFGGFDFLPGDQISVYYVVAPTDANYDNWNNKTWALITFGAI